MGLDMKTLLVTCAIAIALPATAVAGSVGIGAFGAPSVSQTQFDSLGSGNVTNEVSPFALGIATYSSDSGTIQVWGSGPGAGFADCNGGCVTNGFEQELDVSLNHAYGAVGLFVGQATPYTLDVSFLSASNVVLGSEVVSNTNSGGGLSFVGWASGAGVQTVDITNPNANNFDVSAASIFTASGAPEPASWALMLLGVGGIGAGLRLARGRAEGAATAA